VNKLILRCILPIQQGGARLIHEHQRKPENISFAGALADLTQGQTVRMARAMGEHTGTGSAKRQQNEQKGKNP
jgi:hypothetical protein